jgi:hypothetical protein
MFRPPTAESIIDVRSSASNAPSDLIARTVQSRSGTGEVGERTAEIQTPPASSVSVLSAARQSKQEAAARLKLLADANLEAAAALNELMRKHSISTASLARRCGQNEKIVRCWRTGERPIPAGLLKLVQEQIYDGMFDHFTGSRKRPPKGFR